MSRFPFAALIVAVALSMGAAAQASEGPVVRVTEGQARGVAADGVTSFKGLPYAAAPVGALRWRPPQTPAAWSGVRDASAYGDDCVQKRAGSGSTQSKLPVSEDCLTLNVWAPEGAARASGDGLDPRRRLHHGLGASRCSTGRSCAGAGSWWSPSTIASAASASSPTRR